MDRTTIDELEDKIRHDLPGLGGAEVVDLALVVRRVASALSAEKVYVFGSQARGEARADSDIDLLVVVPATDQPSYRLDQAAYNAAASHSLPLEILVMPQEEFERRSRALASLPATVLREGKLLYAA